MSVFERRKKTATLIQESGVKVEYAYDPGSGFKWRAKLRHPSFSFGSSSEFAWTLWGLNAQIRKTCRRVIRSGQMQNRADGMTRQMGGAR